jgi:uncharacterized protein YcbK (DUF882 family)
MRFIGPKNDADAGAPHPCRRSMLGLGLAAIIAADAVPSPASAAAGGGARVRRLHVVNPHTGESFRDAYWADGTYIDDATADLAWLMRDYHVDRTIPIDPALFDVLHRISERLGRAGPVELMSGYRTPETNARLRREGRRAAKHSLHLHGRAADIRIPGVGVGTLRRAALAAGAGGIGCYPGAGFVHVDTRASRTWWSR